MELEIRKVEQVSDDIFKVTFFEDGVKKTKPYSYEGLKLAVLPVNKGKGAYDRHLKIKEAIDSFKAKKQERVKDVKADRKG